MGIGESIKDGHDEYRRIFAKLFKSSTKEVSSSESSCSRNTR